MHIDVCAIPSFDAEKRALINHYNIVVPTEGLLIPVQSLEETLADKFIALAYRARRIKPRDVWDII
ncbi:nucleotidyl transferase AbiEii/AbiGii toxin family protein [Vibrio sp. F74]|uniref:nucleotidyl transferase AbiEii/AbiGii toxin family protein n=1 Tax=Vibrio sp. F74 TaxID=700020 RepID=UPI0035F5C807